MEGDTTNNGKAGASSAATNTTTPPSVLGIAGGEHSLLWKKNTDDDSTITTTSLFSTGACGLGWCRNLPLQRDLFQFRPIISPTRSSSSSSSSSSSISKSLHLVYASYYHNLAVTAQNQLYAWGCGTFVEGGMDGVIPALGPSPKPQDLGQEPQHVPLPNAYATEKIVQISGGAYHSIVLMESGTILTFGAGQLGQLGRQLQDKDASGLFIDPQPRPVEGSPYDNAASTTKEKVVKIGSGFYNTLAITQDGSLYCTGENQNQQCGVGPKNLYRMKKVVEINNVDQVDGGYCHTLIKTLKGHVYSMGCGEDGQRGDGILESEDDNGGGPQRSVMNRIALDTPVQQVAAGANHSVVLGDDGVAYTFGANDVGQCGVDKDGNVGGDPIVTPQAVKLPRNEKVVHVSAGYAHTVVTTASGKLYAFGQNDSGQLGVGAEDFDRGIDPEAQTKPIQIPTP